jgi:hypothetical protein
VYSFNNQLLTNARHVMQSEERSQLLNGVVLRSTNLACSLSKYTKSPLVPRLMTLHKTTAMSEDTDRKILLPQNVQIAMQKAAITQSISSLLAKFSPGKCITTHGSI